MTENMIRNMVENMQGEITFGELWSAIYETPTPNPSKPNEWKGPGFYRICDAYDGCSTLQYCETEDAATDVFWETDYFMFVCEDVPDGYIDLAKRAWDGAGYYVVDRLREMAWEDDTQWIGYANDEMCLADGLFREFDSREILGIRKASEADEADESMGYFECPQKLHGETDPY